MKLGASPVGIYSDNGVSLVGLMGPDGTQYPLSNDFNIPLVAGVAGAAANTQALQSACNAGGLIQLLTPGVYYVAGTVYQPSECGVYLGPGVELWKVPGSTASPFFMNKNWKPTLQAVTSVTFAPVGVLSVSQMAIMTIQFTSALPADMQGNTIAPGNYLMLDGDLSFATNGAHKVLSVNPATLQVVTQFGCTALPSGSYSIPTFAINACSFSGATLTVTATTGIINQGQTLTGANVAAGTMVESQTAGITISACSFSGNTLTVTGVSGGALAVGQTLTGSNIASGTTITALGTGTGGTGTYTVSTSGNTGTSATAWGGAGTYMINIAGSTATSCTAMAALITGCLCDHNIGVFGAGRLNGNVEAGGITQNNTYMDHGILFNNVANAYVGGGELGYLTIDDTAQYLVCMQRTQNARAVGIATNYSRKDGVHFFGPQYGRPVIKHIQGDFGDDVAIFDNVSAAVYFPLQIGATYNGNTVYGGDYFEGGLIEDLNVTYAGNNGGAVLYPMLSAGGPYIGTTAFRMHGVFIIRNIGKKYPVANGVSGSAWAIGAGYSVDAGFIDNVIIDDAHGPFYMNNAMAGKTIYIDELVLRGGSTWEQEDWFSNILDYCNINRLALYDFNSYNWAASAAEQILYLNSANVTVNKIEFIGGKVNAGPNDTQLSLVGSPSTGGSYPTVNMITFRGLEMLGASGLLLDGSLFANTPTIDIDDIDYTNCSNYPISYGGSQSFNILARAIKGNGAFFNLYGTGHAGTLFLWLRDLFTNGNAAVFNGGANARIIDAANYNTPNVQAPTTGGTITLTNGWGFQLLVVNPAGTLAALTLALPSTPIDGEILQITFTQAITALTVSGGTLLGMPASVAAGFGSTWKYNATAGKWVQL